MGSAKQNSRFPPDCVRCGGTGRIGEKECPRCAAVATGAKPNRSVFLPRRVAETGRKGDRVLFKPDSGDYYADRED